MNDYKDEPGKNQEINKEVRESNTGQGKQTLEKQGPQKKNLNVLNEDGSLADLPDQHVEGGGALDGTVSK